MATNVTKVDDFSKEDRALIVTALKLQKASYERAARAERDPMIAELRGKAASYCDLLIARFS